MYTNLATNAIVCPSMWVAMATEGLYLMVVTTVHIGTHHGCSYGRIHEAIELQKMCIVQFSNSS